MNVKIDTKERFTVITPIESTLSANMTAELSKMLYHYLQKDIPHIVLNMKNISDIDKVSGKSIVDIQQLFYENGNSFVICELQKDVEKKLDEFELLEVMNFTPTESEAWDILQMEEIEREMFNEDDEL